MVRLIYFHPLGDKDEITFPSRRTEFKEHARLPHAPFHADASICEM